MSSIFSRSIMGGIVATIALTLIIRLAPLLGLPEVNPPKMLAVTAGLPIDFGWLMHFFIGIFFALVYGYLFLPLVDKISSKAAKGALYGIVIFVFAQIMLQIIGATFPDMPSPKANMMLIMMEKLVAHIVFGIVLALFFKNSSQQAERV